MHSRDIVAVAVSLAAVGAAVTSCKARTPAAIRVADAVVAVNFDTGACKAGREWTKSALDDLTNVVFKTTGRLLPVFAEGEEPGDARAVIYLGDTKAARAAGVDPSAMRNGDWRVKAVPGKVFVYGKTGKGASFAMTEFVERFCGYAFLSPDGEDPFVYNPGLEVPVCDVAVKPAIYDRGIYHGVRYTSRFSKDEMPMWDRFSRRRRAPEFYGAEMENTRRISGQVKSCHSFYEYLPPAKYFKEHPEWYSMNKAGKRTAKLNAESQLCFSNREMWKELLKSLERFVERDRRQNPTNYPCIYDFSQMDNSDFICLCPECKKVIAKYNRVPGGHKEGGDAGLVLECVNWLAREIARKYPDVQIRTFAYVSTGCAPKPGTIAVEPNVVIRWCDVYSVSDHSRPLETPGHFNEKQAAELGDWLKLTKNVHLWDYMLYGDSYPEVCVEAFAGDARFFAKNGLSTIFMETEYGRQPFYLLNYYLLSQLYIDPSQDPWALVRSWCRVYGPAADEMYEAIRFADRIALESPTSTSYDWHIRRLPWRTRENMEALAALVRKAYAKLGPDRPRERARVAHVLSSTLQEIIRMLMPKTDAESRKALEAAKAEFLECSDYYAANGCICEADRPKVKTKAHDVIDLMSLKFKDLPPELKDVPADDLVCVDYHRSWNKNEDPSSERGYTTVAKWGSMKFGFPTGCGIYDWGTKDSYPFSIKATGAVEGKYSWQKLGVAHLGSHTGFWFPSSWLNRIELRAYYILADGLPVDPNWYEVWVSVKIEGPTAFPGSSRKDLLALDRMALRRVQPPK